MTGEGNAPEDGGRGVNALNALPAGAGHGAAAVAAIGTGAVRGRLLTAKVMRLGQHAITGVLLVIAVVRGMAESTGPGWLVPIVGIGFALWYLGGLPRLARRESAAGLDASGRTMLWLGVLLAIWAAGLAASSEFMWLAFSLWLLIGHLLPLASSVLVSLLVYALAIVAPFLHHGQTSYASIIGPLVGGCFAWGISRGYLQLLRDAQERNALVSSLLQAHREMAGLHEELARSQHQAGVLAERARLARDIHDTVAQQLASISLHARAATGAGDAAGAVNALERVQQLAGQALADLRRIIAALAPAELEDQALAGALGRMLEKLGEETGIRTELRADADVPALDTTVQVALLRVAQSALANIRRHAHANQVVLSLQLAGGMVRLDIFDDGIGFDADSWQQAPTHLGDGGFGLRSMRERLRELGGGLDVESTPGTGTGLSAYLPLRP